MHAYENCFLLRDFVSRKRGKLWIITYDPSFKIYFSVIRPSGGCLTVDSRNRMLVTVVWKAYNWCYQVIVSHFWLWRWTQLVTQLIAKWLNHCRKRKNRIRQLAILCVNSHLSKSRSLHFSLSVDPLPAPELFLQVRNTSRCKHYNLLYF